MNDVLKFLDSLNIADKDKIVIAVSYGPDSMALLDIIRRRYSSSDIICAHVNHNHRKESYEEADKLKSFCDKNDIIFEMMKIENYTGGKFTEEDARNRRYTFFKSILKKYNSKYLFTAHHGDDLVETILMKIVRGSSLKGYSGISLISDRDNYKIIRPLLFLTKDDLLKYCKDNNISYAIDNSNYSDKYTRNRYRKYILPSLKKEDENVHKKFMKFSLVLKESEEYFERVTNSVYDEVILDGKVNITLLKKQDSLIIKRVIMKFLHKYYDSEISKLDSKHISNILSVVESKKPNLVIELPNKVKLVKSYNILYLDKKNNYNSYCYLFDSYISLPNGYCIKNITDDSDKSNYIIMLNSKEINMPLYIRNKVKGDCIEVLNLNGSKKVKDIFIDEKIPKQNRDNYPILVDSKGNILWIPGIKKSKYDKSKHGKYDIILKYQREEK